MNGKLWGLEKLSHGNSPIIIDYFQVDVDESSRHCSVHQWRCIITFHEIRLSILKGRYPTFNRLDYRFTQSRTPVIPFKYSFTHTHTHTHIHTHTHPHTKILTNQIDEPTSFKQFNITPRTARWVLQWDIPLMPNLSATIANHFEIYK